MFSVKTDVWSFGVVVRSTRLTIFQHYNLSRFGKSCHEAILFQALVSLMLRIKLHTKSVCTPFSTVFVLILSAKGLRLPIPPRCPTKFKELMTFCWADDPDDRPNFQQIGELLDQIGQEINTY